MDTTVRSTTGRPTPGRGGAICLPFASCRPGLSSPSSASWEQSCSASPSGGSSPADVRLGQAPAQGEPKPTPSIRFPTSRRTPRARSRPARSSRSRPRLLDEDDKRRQTPLRGRCFPPRRPKRFVEESCRDVRLGVPMGYQVSECVSVAPASLAPRGGPQRTRARGTVTRGRLNHGCESFRDHIAAESRCAPSNSGSSLSRREVRAGASVAIHALRASASATENPSTCSSGREILAAT